MLVGAREVPGRGFLETRDEGKGGFGGHVLLHYWYFCHDR